MKTIFISLLFFVTLAVSANSDLYSLLKDQPYNIAEGVVLPDIDIMDFTTIHSSSAYPLNNPSNEVMLPYDNMIDHWYSYDFAEDPFNGIIEIAVVGEPLPSSTITLFIACLLGCVIFYHKRNASLSQ